MKTATKATLTARVAELEAKVNTLEAAAKAVGTGSLWTIGDYCTGRKTAVAVCLRREERECVQDWAANIVARQCLEGTPLFAADVDNPEQVARFDLDCDEPELLPRYIGYVIRYSHNKHTGTSVDTVWGLVEVK